MYDYIVIGAGQAGLSIAYHLKQAELNFLVVDADQQIGQSWLKRWDSLKLFTPSEYNNLPGLNFDMEKGQYPDKNDVAQYLQNYVKHFELPIKLDCKVSKVTQNDGLHQLTTSKGPITARNIIVATGPFHTPFIPPLSKDLPQDIVQLHSCEYKNPSQLQDGETLVVGAGDSGVQILQEIAETERKVYLSGNCSSSVLPQEFLGKTLWWWFTVTGILSITRNSWLGKKLSKIMQPIIGTDVKRLLQRKNVATLGRAQSAQGNTINFSDDSISSIKNIVWATGFRPDFSWIDNIELDAQGYPINERGVTQRQGLYFIGLPWMYTRGSATLGGVQHDAQYLIEHILAHHQATNFSHSQEPLAA